MKLASSVYLERIGKITLATALSYENSDEQYLYCIDYLEISAHDPRADDLVNIMEDYIEDLLKGDA